MAQGSWWTRVLCCPRCGGALGDAAKSLVRCAACGPYPVLAHVPVLVADPTAWCRTWKDSVLATLAQFDAADREAVAVVEAFARDGAASDVFADDWTRHEAEGAPPPSPVRGPASAALATLMKRWAQEGPAAWLEKKIGRPRGLVIELGCGAGERSAVLAKRAPRLVVGDRSLRAVLHARRRAALEGGDVEGVVLDAQQLPFKRGVAEVVVAEHLVDLLDDPGRFLEGVRATLARGGRLLLTTSEPSLGTGEERALDALAVEAGLRVKSSADGLPWLRVNSPRFVETYLVRALELRR